MLDTRKLSDEELRKLFSKPLSEEEEEAMRKANEAARPFLAISLREMDRRESDPNYDPANDPTCVPVTIENDE